MDLDECDIFGNDESEDFVPPALDEESHSYLTEDDDADDVEDHQHSYGVNLTQNLAPYQPVKNEDGDDSDNETLSIPSYKLPLVPRGDPWNMPINPCMYQEDSVFSDIEYPSQEDESTSNYEPIESWSVEKVKYFLQGIGIDSGIVDMFVEHKVNGVALYYVTPRELKDEMGLKLGDRKVIEKAVARIKRKDVFIRARETGRVLKRKREEMLKENKRRKIDDQQQQQQQQQPMNTVEEEGDKVVQLVEEYNHDDALVLPGFSELDSTIPQNPLILPQNPLFQLITGNEPFGQGIPLEKKIVVETKPKVEEAEFVQIVRQLEVEENTKQKRIQLEEENEELKRRMKQQEEESLKLAEKMRIVEIEQLKRKKEEDEKETQKLLKRIREEEQAFEKRRKDQEDIDLKFAMSLKPKKCNICLEEHEMDFFQNLIQCDHQFCRDCLAGYYKSKISEKDFPIACPIPDCPKQITVEDLENILGEDDLKKFEKFQLQSVVEKNKDYSCCPTPGCEYAFFFQEGPRCEKRYCLKCRVEFHQGSTCENYQKWKKENGKGDQLFEKFVRGKKMKQCFGCKAWIEKNQGCDHMTCKICKTEFCYKCGGKHNDCECTRRGRQLINNLHRRGRGRGRGGGRRRRR